MCELANHYKHKNMTVYDRLMEIYQEFGDFKAATYAYEFKGLSGKAHIEKIMSDFKDKSIKEKIPNIDHLGDYLEQKIHYKDHDEPTNLPKSNVIKFFLKDGETITIRPSGTEPKLKAYVFAFGRNNLDMYSKIIDSLIKEE